MAGLNVSPLVTQGEISYILGAGTSAPERWPRPTRRWPSQSTALGRDLWLTTRWAPCSRSCAQPAPASSLRACRKRVADDMHPPMDKSPALTATAGIHHGFFGRGAASRRVISPRSTSRHGWATTRPTLPTIIHRAVMALKAGPVARRPRQAGARHRRPCHRVRIRHR